MQGKSHRFWRLGQRHLWGLFFCLLYCVKQRCDNTPENKLFAGNFLRGRSFLFISCPFLGPNIQFNILPPKKRGFPDGTSGKESTCQCRRQETQVQSLGWEDPLEEEMKTCSSILSWKIPRTEEPCGLQSMESQSQTLLCMHDPENVRRQLPTRKGMGTDLE